MKKKILIPVGILTIIVIWILYSWFTLDDPKSSFDKEGIIGNIEEHWNIRLPEEGQLEYEIDDVTGLPMDGLTYAIFSYPKDKDLGDAFEWISIKKTDIETVKELLNDLSVEENQMPQFEKAKIVERSQSNDTLYLIYEENVNKLYIVELMI